MIEHVGWRNYRRLMKIASSVLDPGGLFLLQTIGAHQSSTHTTDPWFDKYIFPGGMFPSLRQLAEAAERVLVIEDVHNFGHDYSLTLEAWYKNFEEHWNTSDELLAISEAESRQTFFRMWRYYLMGIRADFRARRISLWQLVLSKDGVRGGYRSSR